MEPDDLLCSRNAREEKGGLVVLLLAERAPSEGPRSTRAFEDRPGHPLKRETSKLGGNIDRAVLAGRAQWRLCRPPRQKEYIESDYSTAAVEPAWASFKEGEKQATN